MRIKINNIVIIIIKEAGVDVMIITVIRKMILVSKIRKMILIRKNWILNVKHPNERGFKSTFIRSMTR